MAEITPLTGELQAQVMSAMWRLGVGTVVEVNSALPPLYRGAHNKIHTILNRLAERGLLSRNRVGNAVVYRPVISEAEYLTRSISNSLAAASNDARQAALAQLIGDLDKQELKELQQLAKQMNKGRRKR